jgi:hypothetical protein
MTMMKVYNTLHLLLLLFNFSNHVVQAFTSTGPPQRHNNVQQHRWITIQQGVVCKDDVKNNACFMMKQSQSQQQQQSIVSSLSSKEQSNLSRSVRSMGTMIMLLSTLINTPSMVYADGQTNEFRFPPIDKSNMNRCVLVGGSSMGQANAARDKLYDLRQCQLSNVQAVGYDLSGVST